MVNQNCKKLKTALTLPLFCFLIFSCASTPKPETFYKDRSGFGLVAEGAVIYLTAEVQSVRPILDSLVLGGMSGAEIKQFLDMSDVITAAVFQTPGVRHFYAAAEGSFPSATGGLFFSASKDWEKRTSASGMPYWYSQRSQLAISINAKFAYLSDVDPFVNAPGARVPGALPAMQKGSVLSGWMNNPSPAINRLIAAFNVPIEIPADRLLFAVYQADEDAGKKASPGKAKSTEESLYQAVLRFETPTTTQAAALVRVFTLAKLGIAFADFSEYKDMETLAKAFFSNNPQADGNALILKTGTMSGKDLALLFNTISLN